MGVGRAGGKDKAETAANMAIQSPLLETSISGARGVLVNVTGSPDIGLDEVEIAATMVQQAAHPDAHIIFGAAIDENLEDEIHITVIATGFDDRQPLDKDGLFTNIITKAEEAVKETAVRAEEAKKEIEAQPKEEAPSQATFDEKKEDKVDDDEWSVLMNMFNKKNR